MTMRFCATTKLGLESTVAIQLKQLGIEPVETLDARVLFDGDFDTMARSLLWLRTAERLLLVVGSFEARSFDELFEQTKALDWKPFLSPKTRIHVNGKSAKSTLFSVSDCQSIVKKAIVESLKASYRVDTIPETGEEVIVEVGILKDAVTLALDCCGAGLSRRGYRTFNVPAPLSETLGAGMVMLSRFFPDTPLIDPMCGSGTIPIEAAMIANNIAPSRNRLFSSEAWKFVPSAAFARAREEAHDAERHDKLCIVGRDIDPHCIDLCKKHAKKAGVMLDWKVADVRDLVPERERGVILCNPPYGERLLDEREVKRLYRQMRGVFDRFPGWEKSIITAMRDFETVYGKKADKRRKLSNGGMTCTVYRYFAERPQKRD
ncbi:MAG: class I SAM-dependent RNA methyltransferase [Clostridia bacterium]|nr:class I SAM-dependent RNA methyltransferase [Clostridia bacterium]